MPTIAIDGRALQTEPYTGVSYYLKNILVTWGTTKATADKKLYFNQSRSWQPPAFVTNKFAYKQTFIPNKLLQILWSISSFPQASKLSEEDTIWLPNINFLSRLSNKRLVLSIHDLSFIHFPEYYTYKMRMWHKLLAVKKLVKEVDTIITFSESGKQDIADYFSFPLEKIVVIPHGVDEYYFTEHTCTNDEQLPNEYIAFVGSIEPRKNVVTLVAAFEKLAVTHSELHLVIAGSKGWLSKKLIIELKNSPFADRIQYKGYVTDEVKRQILQHAKVFAFPSFYEGFGLPVLEAFASGCAVVAGATGSLPELVDTNGILINPHQTNELTLAIDLLLTDDTLREKYKNLGKVRAREFTWEEAAMKTHAVLRGEVV